MNGSVANFLFLVNFPRQDLVALRMKKRKPKSCQYKTGTENEKSLLTYMHANYVEKHIWVNKKKEYNKKFERSDNVAHHHDFITRPVLFMDYIFFFVLF